MEQIGHAVADLVGRAPAPGQPHWARGPDITSITTGEKLVAPGVGDPHRLAAGVIAHADRKPYCLQGRVSTTRAAAGRKIMDQLLQLDEAPLQPRS